MDKLKKISSNRAITLVALIITIIVMLILIAVSVQVVINSNLIGAAQNAGDKTETAYGEEGNMSQIAVGDKNYANINDYMNDRPITEDEDDEEEENTDPVTEIHNWTRNGDTLNCKCTTCTASNAEGTTYTIGQLVEYTIVGGAETVTLTGAETGIAQGITDGIIPADVFGENGAQTISRDENTQWVILGIENTNGVGGNETLLITTAAPTEDSFCMRGVAGYNNAITIGENLGVFDKACKTLYGTASRSITMADVDNVLNADEYGLLAGVFFDEYGDGYTIGDLDTPLSELGDVWTAIQENAATNEDEEKIYYTPEHPGGTTTASDLGKYNLDGYFYWVQESDEGDLFLNNFSTGDANSIITTNTKNVIFGHDYDFAYWLASRGVAVLGPSGVRFSTGFVADMRVDGGVGYGANLGSVAILRFFYDSNGESGIYGGDFSVRAVVPLTAELPEVVEVEEE